MNKTCTSREVKSHLHVLSHIYGKRVRCKLLKANAQKIRLETRKYNLTQQRTRMKRFDL